MFPTVWKCERCQIIHVQYLISTYINHYACNVHTRVCMKLFIFYIQMWNFQHSEFAYKKWNENWRVLDFFNMFWYLSIFSIFLIISVWDPLVGISHACASGNKYGQLVGWNVMLICAAVMLLSRPRIPGAPNEKHRHTDLRMTSTKPLY